MNNIWLQRAIRIFGTTLLGIVTPTLFIVVLDVFDIGGARNSLMRHLTNSDWGDVLGMSLIYAGPGAFVLTIVVGLIARPFHRLVSAPADALAPRLAGALRWALGARGAVAASSPATVRATSANVALRPKVDINQSTLIYTTALLGALLSFANLPVTAFAGVTTHPDALTVSWFASTGAVCGAFIGLRLFLEERRRARRG